MESILTSVKKLLGISEEYTQFDPDIVIHINSVFAALTQLGAGPPEGFSIRDASANWNEFLTDAKKLNFVKSYMYLRVRLLFDPPTGSAMIESMNRAVNEFEWRIQVEADSTENE